MFSVCIFYFAAVSTVGLGIVGSTSAAVDISVGYLSRNQLKLPLTVVNSTNMTTRACLDFCGLNQQNYAFIYNISCICYNELLGPPTSQCQSTLPCPGNSSQTCGCLTDQTGNVYSTGSPVTYVVTILLAKNFAGFAVQVSYNLFGTNERESREITTATMSIKTNQGSFGVQFASRNLTHYLENLYKVRIAVSTSICWTGVTVQDLNTSHTTTFNCSPCVDITQTKGHFYQAVDCFSDGTVAQPVFGNGYYEYNSNLQGGQTVIMIYPNGCGCLNYQGIYYEHNICFSGFNYSQITGCDSFTTPSYVKSGSGNSPTNGDVISPGTTNNYQCKNGYFNGSLNTSLQMTCGQSGLWSPPTMPPCINVCLAPPIPPGQAIYSWNSSDTIVPALETIQYCCPTNTFDGTTSNLLNITCSSNGNWSITTIPNCSSGLVSGVGADAIQSYSCSGSGKLNLFVFADR